MSRSALTDDDLIARYLKERGVTRCPAAYAVESAASISEDDRLAHAARGLDPVGDAWRKKHAKRRGGWNYGWSGSAAR